MERERAEVEMDCVTDSDEEAPCCDSTSLRPSSEWETTETKDECHHEDKAAYLKSQDTPSSAIRQDYGNNEVEYCGSTEAKEEGEDEFEPDGVTDQEDCQGINQDEDDAAGGQHMNGESDWRTEGSGRRCRLRSGGLASEQGNPNPLFSMPKGNFMSSGSRHRQTRRRNHHHHHQQQQGRARRRTGNQLVSALKEILSESLSFWCISCIHMMIEIIVTLTHNCGVGVESGGVKLYKLGQRLLAKITDTAGLKADAGRVLNWTKCVGGDLADRLVGSVKWAKKVSLACLKVFCGLILLGSRWTKALLARLGGERGKRAWTVFQETRFWKMAVSLLEKVQCRFRSDGRSNASGPDSPGRAGRGQPGQELERLLALAEVPEDELDPFTVLGVELHATEAELKKAYRQLAVQVGPKLRLLHVPSADSQAVSDSLRLSAGSLLGPPRQE